MKAVAAALALFAAEAAAQGPGSEALLVIAIGPPALVSVALDVALLSTLLKDGSSATGRSISTIVFGTVTCLVAAICLGLGLSRPGSTLAWNVASAAALGAGVGTIAVGVYGVTRPPPVAPVEPLPVDAPAKKEPLPQL